MAGFKAAYSSSLKGANSQFDKYVKPSQGGIKGWGGGLEPKEQKEQKEQKEPNVR